jgi:hypothetical protein
VLFASPVRPLAQDATAANWKLFTTCGAFQSAGVTWKVLTSGRKLNTLSLDWAFLQQNQSCSFSPLVSYARGSISLSDVVARPKPNKEFRF